MGAQCPARTYNRIPTYIIVFQKKFDVSKARAAEKPAGNSQNLKYDPSV